MLKPVSYLQTDKRWKNTSYSVKGESTTIGRAGCGPTCGAMVIATLKDQTVTPVEACDFSIKNNYKQKGGGTYANFFPSYLKKYGLSCQILWSSAEAQDEKVRTALKSGNWVIACMGKGLWTSGGHYILAYGTDGTYVFINDPASTKTSRTCAKLSQFLKESKYYIIVDVPNSAKSSDTAYTKFVKSCQKVVGLPQTGVADSKLLSKTVTLKANGTNKQHELVKPVQTYLKALGYYNGNIHGFFDPAMAEDVKKYQEKVVKLTGKNIDGVITAKKNTWKKLLKL
jgi:hypothetical protein